MNILKIQDKIKFWMARIYTRLASKLFASFGEGGILFFPSRFENPGQINIGRNVFIDSSVWLNPVKEWNGKSYSGKIDIHDDVIIMGGVQISSIANVVLESRCSVSRNCTIVDHNHDFWDVNHTLQKSSLSRGFSVTLSKDSYLGVGCVVGPGVTIGEHSFVGANSVVTRSIPAYSYASGNPAKVIRQYNWDSRKWEKPTLKKS